MLRTVIEMLPEEYKKVLILHHLQQIPYEEIGAMLQCTPRAARVKACRARAALRRLLLNTSPSDTTRPVSSNMLERLDACCRRNLAKNATPRKSRTRSPNPIPVLLPYLRIRQAEA
jgi:hypothetical protein